jgi:hypothetical protein
LKGLLWKNTLAFWGPFISYEKMKCCGSCPCSLIYFYGIAYFFPYHLLVLTEKTVKIKAGILETFFEDDLTEISNKIQS